MIWVADDCFQEVAMAFDFVSLAIDLRIGE
jgi:hypothetical protein